MKKKLLMFALITSTLFFLSSCKKSSAAVASGAGSASSLAAGKCDIRCTYNGAASGSLASSLSLSSATSISTIYNIFGGALNGTTVLSGTIAMPANIAAGTYTQASAGAGLPNNMTFNFSSGSATWFCGGGTATGFKIIVTAVTANTVEGTFSGDLGSDVNITKVTITNGTFSAKF